MCWLSWFSCPGCCPGLQFRLGASDCAFVLGVCFMGLWTFTWICCPQLPHRPCKNGTHSTCFYITEGGARRFYVRDRTTFYFTGRIMMGVPQRRGPVGNRFQTQRRRIHIWDVFNLIWICTFSVPPMAFSLNLTFRACEGARTLGKGVCLPSTFSIP